MEANRYNLRGLALVIFLLLLLVLHLVIATVAEVRWRMQARWVAMHAARMKGVQVEVKSLDDAEQVRFCMAFVDFGWIFAILEGFRWIFTVFGRFFDGNQWISMDFRWIFHGFSMVLLAPEGGSTSFWALTLQDFLKRRREEIRREGERSAQALALEGEQVLQQAQGDVERKMKGNCRKMIEK